MDAFDALSTAAAGFERRLRAVGAGQWKQPTPCTEWDVRALVNHVVGANVRYTMLLHGATSAAVDATRSIDHVGEDAVGAFLATFGEMTAAFREPGALDRIAHHPSGDRSGVELLAMRVLDVAVHSWDLARAVGADDVLDPDVVRFVQARMPNSEPGRTRGSFAAAVEETASGGSPQGRLLRKLGRCPT
jgi:uncharacterized protein (TIGR03086 family)